MLESQPVFQRNTSPAPPHAGCLAYSSTPKLVAKCSSKIFADFHQTTRRYMPEDRPARTTCLLVNASSKLTVYKFGGKILKVKLSL